MFGRTSGVFNTTVLLLITSVKTCTKPPMKDIETRSDLKLLLDTFYDRLLRNPEMNRIFIEVAGIDLETHLPTITDFWEQSLFHTGNYRNNTLAVHLDLHAKSGLKPDHFSIWLDAFEDSVRSLFSGPVAEKAITRAHSIATVIQLKTNIISK